MEETSSFSGSVACFAAILFEALGVVGCGGLLLGVPAFLVFAFVLFSAAGAVCCVGAGGFAVAPRCVFSAPTEGVPNPDFGAVSEPFLGRVAVIGLAIFDTSERGWRFEAAWVGVCKHNYCNLCVYVCVQIHCTCIIHCTFEREKLSTRIYKHLLSTYVW